MRRLSAAMSLAAFVSGGHARAGSTAETSSLSGAPLRLTDVDPSDGIDVNEAGAIARAYFEHEYGDCGGPGEVTRKRGTWVFKVTFGLAGQELKETIDVDAKSGGVWAQRGHRYRDFASFRDAPDIDPRWREGTPPEVVDFVERYGGCNHWGGEEAYSVERRKEIEDGAERLRCDRLDADQRRLRRRYARDPRVLRVIEGASAYEGG